MLIEIYILADQRNFVCAFFSVVLVHYWSKCDVKFPILGTPAKHIQKM